MSISLNNFTCPHCLKENATMFDVAKFKRPLSLDTSIVFACRTCDKSTIIDISLDRYGRDLISTGNNFVVRINGNYISFNGIKAGDVTGIYPVPKAIKIPENLPDNIGKYLLESKDHFKRGFYETSIMVCRKSLDLATKELARNLPESEKITKLTKRIYLLKDNGIITKDIFDWSIIIRDDGDEATHSDTEFNEKAAEELINFTEIFLLYTFTLPKMVEMKRAKLGQD